MTIVFYDLKGRDGLRFSPFGWRVRYALAHKGLAHEDVGVGFNEKDRVAFSGQPLVPVIVDKANGDRVVFDSMQIARYLDEAFPGNPLIDSPQAWSLSRFVNNWVGTVMFPGIIGQIMADLYVRVRDVDQPYFRESREKRFGRTLEQMQEGREKRLPAFRASLDPLRILVRQQPFVCGEAPGYADYIVLGAFQWASIGGDYELLEPEDAIAAWRARMLDLYDGLGRRAIRGPQD